MLRRHLLPLNALRAFEAVASQLSFTGAAKALHISQSALSRHVSKLEELLGQQLLERRPHGLVLTRAGASLLPVLRKSFDRLEEVLSTIEQEGQGKPRTLRVHMPPSFLHQQGLQILREFRALVPDIVIDVSSSNGTGLPTRDLDVAVVYDRPQAGDAVRDLLWMTREQPACAPDVGRQAEGLSLQEFLLGQQLIHVKMEGMDSSLHWANFARSQGLALRTDSGLAFETATLAVQFAMGGLGVLLVDTDLFARELAEGRLVTPFAETYESGYGYYLTLHPEDMADPAIALFRSWMIERFARARRERPRGSSLPS
ncbi:LysR family transcriptional regulator, glycine cleavage system transcriptional activator [Arboricoccus pini]|uniref:LysR family transcriptional regulator, glycine cleavage system transcriptional activator n=1 Tax=Arboricoccus pini TaxID=1963835 RepID=A0A212RRW3_9PROT|nr:LysR family transcriptional regulator [Arboricoccus pini]SNB75349.1 LysR family transcriptional regulator, glycine cleavage system transcriptional activator [Arboricoccus pini]